MRRTHVHRSKEYKQKIMKLIEEGIPIKIISEKFGIPKSTIYSWENQQTKYGEDAFVGSGQQRAEDAELRRLKNQVKRLEMENELLKKVAAYQAQLETEK